MEGPSAWNACCHARCPLKVAIKFFTDDRVVVAAIAAYINRSTWIKMPDQTQLFPLRGTTAPCSTRDRNKCSCFLLLFWGARRVNQAKALAMADHSIRDPRIQEKRKSTRKENRESDSPPPCCRRHGAVDTY